MKTLKAKSFDQNPGNWKRENPLLTLAVLAARASGQNRIGTHILRSHRTVDLSSLLKLFFLFRNWIPCHLRLLLAKWPHKPEKKLRRRPFFDIAYKYEQLYDRSLLYASAQGRQENWRCSFAFLWLSFVISMKNSVQRWSSDLQGLFRVKNQENCAWKLCSLHAPLNNGVAIKQGWHSFEIDLKVPFWCGGGGFATKPRIRFEFVWTHAQCMPTFRVNACAVHAWSLYRKHGDEGARRLRVDVYTAYRSPRCAAADFRGSFLSMWCRSLVFFLSFFFCPSLVDSGNL